MLLVCVSSVVKPSLNGYIYKSTASQKTQGTLWKRRQEDCESKGLGVGVHAVRLYLLVISEVTPIKSYQHGSLNLNKDDINRHAKVDGKMPVRLQPSSYSSFYSCFSSLSYILFINHLLLPVYI